jgi:hypothetical protein
MEVADAGRGAGADLMARGLFRFSSLSALLQLIRENLRLARRGHRSHVVVLFNGRGDLDRRRGQFQH